VNQRKPDFTSTTVTDYYDSMRRLAILENEKNPALGWVFLGHAWPGSRRSSET
jgi:hypothetical protein